MSSMIRVLSIENVTAPTSAIMGIREHLGIDLMKAKQFFESLQEGNSVEVNLEDEEQSEELIRKLRELGFEAEVYNTATTDVETHPTVPRLNNES